MESHKKFINRFESLPHTQEGKSNERGTMSLRDFVEYYATNLPNLIRAFPENVKDLDTLESHYWDRLKHFYYYENFSEVDIAKKSELEFVNKAIQQIQEWFYKGQWTSCLKTPSAEEIKKMFATRKHSHLEVERGKDTPNLGRDVRGMGKPLPNIYEDLKQGGNVEEVWQEHAFKFFHNPAAVMNTLTKLRINAWVGLKVETTKRDELLKSATAHARGVLGADNNFARVENFNKNFSRGFYNRLPAYQQELYLLKNSMVAAELLRRHGGVLTKEVFEEIMSAVDAEVDRAKSEGGTNKFISFNFAPGGGRSRSSMIHISPDPLPLSLFAVDKLRKDRLQK